ncbi:MAG: hypothetical protein KGZ79_05655 [Dethiobacter sp.]|nr:hypothetical protein [Dethiobacter sp.]
MFGLSIDVRNADGSQTVGSAKGGEYYGLTTMNVTSVKLGKREAELITLNDKDLKVWIFYKPTNQDLEYELQFIDKTPN